MFFSKELTRAQKWLRENNSPEADAPKEPSEAGEPWPQEPELEKGDLPLLMFLATVIIIPICLLALLAICGFVFFL